jgi:hypothetical protein
MEALNREQKAERIAESMTIYKVDEGYKVPSERDPQSFYVISKINGKVRCSCPDFMKHGGENGFRCKHIQAAVISFKMGRIVVEKTPTSQILEYKFRPDQVRNRNGLEYVESAAIIQRLNDAFGHDGWSYEIIEQKTVEEEVITRGRLTIYGPDREIVKEQIGSHSFARGRESNEILSRGDTMKASATDALKKCSSLLGIGLHLHSQGDRYLSFQAA